MWPATVDAVRRQQTGVGPVARWLLLLLTAFGLTMMHTLGHAGMQMDQPTSHPSGMHAAVVAAADSPAMADLPAVAAAPDACPGDHCPHQPGMDGWSICLAILGGLAVIVLLAVRLAARRTSLRPGAAAGRTGRGPRPPPWPGTGLLIASTAALRI